MAFFAFFPNNWPLNRGETSIIVQSSSFTGDIFAKSQAQSRQ
jgi:hypothetical protein